jgi:hypothetical protein
MTGGIPFNVSLPKAPTVVNADAMTVERLRAELMAGYEDMKQGHAQDAPTAFAKFREAHG